MKTARKHLKEVSALILILTALSVVSIIVNIFLNGLTIDVIPEGMTQEFAKAVLIVTYAVSFLLLLPRAYIGYKGWKVSSEPDASKAHIVWAKILIAFHAIAVFGAISELVKMTNLLTNALSLAESVLAIVIFVFYIKFANAVRKNA